MGWCPVCLLHMADLKASDRHVVERSELSKIRDALSPFILINSLRVFVQLDVNSQVSADI